VTPRNSLVWARFATDALVAAAAVGLAYWLRYKINPGHIAVTGGEVPQSTRYIQATPVVVLTLLGVFWAMGAYRHRRGVQYVDEFLATMRALAVAAVVLLAGIRL